MTAPGIKRLLKREDFRSRPFRALSRRVIWRIRSLSNNRLSRLRLRNGLTIFAPHSGAGALIYYQGCTEPETTRFLERFLRPGMTFIDIGAHIGEYVLVASRRVGSSGKVHAFEPQPDTFEILRRNTECNQLKNVSLHTSALADSDGLVEFSVCSEPSLSSILPETGERSGSGVLRTITVPKCHLDTYCAESGTSPNLIKVDVEGAEMNVLRGAGTLLDKPSAQAPVWLFEYTPHTYARFGHSGADVVNLLAKYTYMVYSLSSTGDLAPIVSSRHTWDRSQNLVASKRPINLA